MRSLTHQLLLERQAIACRLDLPRDGAAIRAWLDPMGTEWGPRLAAAIATRGRELVRATTFARA